MPRWRRFARAVVFCGLCGLTIAAIVVSIGTVLGAIGEAGLAVAVGLVAFVQLAIVIGSRRRATSGPAAQVGGLDATDAASRERVGEDVSGGRGEPDMAPMRPASRHAAANDAVSESATDTDGTGAETVAAGIENLDQGQLDLLLEPVVELADTRTVYYRASLSMTRQDGSQVGPYLLSLSADRGGFAPALDLALFRRVCPVIRHLKSRSRRPGVFCPLSPQSFAEREVLDELMQFLGANRDAAGGMVIDISQPGLAALSPAGMEGLAYLAELGATLSLSEARPEGPDLSTLFVLGFRFLDLDLEALAASHGWDAFKMDGEICRLADRAEQAGLTVIAANVVRSEQLERIRPFIRLARGTLFSPPRQVRREIAERPVQAAAA